MIRPPVSSVPLAVLAATSLALLFGRAGGSDTDAASPVVEPVARERTATAPWHGDAPALAALERPRRGPDEAVIDLFPGRSWTPPPPPPPAAATPPPAPAPVAPALPYAYMGRIESEDAKPVVYLARGDRVVAASPGEIIDGIYRLESLGDDELVFVFVPLGQRQVLRFEGGGK